MREITALVRSLLAMCLLATAALAQRAGPDGAAPEPAPAVELDDDVAALADRVSRERLMQIVRDLPTTRCAWGDEAHWEGLLEAEAMVIQKLEALGLAPQTQEIPWPARRRRIVSPDREENVTPEEVAQRPLFRNIWVDLPGDDSPQEVLLLSAHLDAVHRSPGADDDGTGVAAILEMARLLKELPRARTLRLMLFNVEEAGLIGSRHYVSEGLDRAEETIVGMASLDMLGYFSDEPNSQRSPIPPIEGVFEPPTVADFIAIGGILRHRAFSQRLSALMLAGSPRLKLVVVDFLPIAPPDMLRSDHAPFLAIGAPAVIMSDTANFRSKHYHTPSDTIETIDAERFEFVMRGLVVAAAQLARDTPLDEGEVPKR